MDDMPIAELAEVYRDLHRHPELAFAEHRTANVVADRLRADGYETTTGVGGTGVVGVLHRGPGATVLLRADMDALPVREATGLPYASTDTGVTAGGETVPVMHACGHDVHTACLLGAARALARDPDRRGTVLAVFQPAEEIGRGARAMVDDGLVERFGRPEVVLGQHVGPLPAGTIGVRSGAAFAASDSLRITLFGRGGHGSRPEVTVDPVLMAAALVVRLQGIVAREIAATDAAVLTVGMLRAGSAANIIPDDAELRLSVRTFEPGVRDTVLAAIDRIARAEAVASRADREPVIESVGSFPSVENDPGACDRVRAALGALDGIRVVDPGVVTGSEDVGLLARAADAPCAYWLLGGGDPALFRDAATVDEVAALAARQPSNHSPHFAPVVEPTLRTGVAALRAAAREWLT